MDILRGRRKKEGGKIGGSETSLFGYKKGLEGQIVIDETEAQVIRRIFDLKDKGFTQRQIVEILREESSYQRRGTRGWCLSQVNRTIKKEEIYRGIEAYRGGGGFKYPTILKEKD